MNPSLATPSATDINLRLRTDLQSIERLAHRIVQTTDISRTWLLPTEVRQKLKMMGILTARIKSKLISLPTSTANITDSAVLAAMDTACDSRTVIEAMSLTFRDQTLANCILCLGINQSQHERQLDPHQGRKLPRDRQLDQLTLLQGILWSSFRLFRTEFTGLYPHARHGDQEPRIHSAFSHQKAMIKRLFLIILTTAINDAHPITLGNVPPRSLNMETVFAQLRQLEICRLNTLPATERCLISSSIKSPAESYNFTAVIRQVWETITAKRCASNLIHVYASAFSDHGADMVHQQDQQGHPQRFAYKCCPSQPYIFDRLVLTSDDRPRGGTASEPLGRGKKEENCAICLEDLFGQEGQAPAFELPCRHRFHLECVGPWLKLENPWMRGLFPPLKRNCPLCRRNFTLLECVLAADAKMRDQQEKQKSR
ncbi:hypothetical protein QBC36DRAFT_293298 [Triangularia setosa]|uniref:RING-type domain-containing protein n=1 Tax=Triangularia setosa TaxID=2587417 RepID=A0AAN7A507_9PEZI|nr:hypothetical protein QBC36DRAFT_293298 [Podospora setosa]